MKDLEKTYADKNMEFYFMMGSDLVPDLIKWDKGQEMIDEINYILFERKGYEYILDENVEKTFQIPKNILSITANQNLISGISSTEVRRRI